VVFVRTRDRRPLCPLHRPIDLMLLIDMHGVKDT
jgi:hypothetical protein